MLVPFSAQSRVRQGHAIPLLTLLCLFVGIRLYRLDTQSLWWDEYLQFGFLGVPDLKAYLTSWIFWSADNVPLFQIILWHYHQLISDTVLGARLLSVSFAAASFLFFYAFVATHFGRREAIYAGIFLAVSAHHTWFAQAIRPYALLELLIMASWFFFFLALRTDAAKWWTAHIAANILALATHPFVVFFFALEALFLLFFRRGNIRLLAAWFGIHAVAGMALAVWLLRNVVYVPDAAHDHYYMPTITKVLFDLLGDDAVLRTNEFSFPITGPPATLFLGAQSFQGLSVYFEYALLLLSGAVAIWGGWQFLALIRSAGLTPRARALAWSMAVFLGPSLMLLFLTFLWRPVFETRYTTYCSLGLYVLLAVAISQVAHPHLRRATLIFCIAIFSYHLLALTSGTTRADWVRTAQEIQRTRKSSEPIFVHFGGQWNDELLAHALNVPVDDVHLAYSIRGLCKSAHDVMNASNDATVWLAVADMGTAATRAGSLLSCFPEPDFNCQFQLIPGTGPISIYRVRRATLSPSVAPLPPRTDEPLAPELYRVAPQLSRESTEEVLSTLLDEVLPPSKLHYFSLSMFLYEIGETELGMVAAEVVTQFHPDYPPGQLAKAVGLALAGKREDAWDTFAKALASDAVWLQRFEGYFRAALLDEAHDAAEQYLEILRRSGFPYRTFKQLHAVLFADELSGQKAKLLETRTARSLSATSASPFQPCGQ
ncbi:MAG: hypothetical protein RLZZ303_396 [Candidatus Hydrogenedentota bacterium]|jgi:hypothetical protein